MSPEPDHSISSALRVKLHAPHFVRKRVHARHAFHSIPVVESDSPHTIYNPVFSYNLWKPLHVVPVEMSEQLKSIANTKDWNPFSHRFVNHIHGGFVDLSTGDASRAPGEHEKLCVFREGPSFHNPSVLP